MIKNHTNEQKKKKGISLKKSKLSSYSTVHRLAVLSLFL